MRIASSSLVAFIPTRNAARARAFYEGTLGLRFVSESPFGLVVDSGGTIVRIQKVESFTPQPFTVLGWTVGDIAAAIAELRGLGVAFERYEFLSQDAIGVWTTPDGTKVAWFKDPDGNTLALSQMGPSSTTPEARGRATGP